MTYRHKYKDAAGIVGPVKEMIVELYRKVGGKIEKTVAPPVTAMIGECFSRWFSSRRKREAQETTEETMARWHLEWVARRYLENQKDNAQRGVEIKREDLAREDEQIAEIAQDYLRRNPGSSDRGVATHVARQLDKKASTVRRRLDSIKLQ